MKRIFSFLRPHVSFIILIGVVFLAVFWPVFFKGQIPSSANLLASFFNPYAQEKFPGWEQGIPNKPTGIDDLRIFYPQRHFSMQTFFSGNLPLWNPYNYSGNFHAGLSETAVFYPLFFLFFFLPQLFAWVILILVEPILAGLGMYLYLQNVIKDKKVAAFGALVFAFCAVVIVRAVEGLSVGHTLIWFPFALYGTEAFFKKKKIRFLLITLIALCFSVFAGWFQFAFYIFGFSFLYAVFRIVSTQFDKKNVIVFLPFFITPFLTLFHIIPAIETLTVSPRGIQSIAQILQMHLMPVTHVFTFIFSDLWGNPGAYTFFGKSEYKESVLYIGVIPFILSLFSVAKLKNKFVVFFATTGVLSLFLGLDTSLTKSLLSMQLPIISTFLPNRIFLITAFSFTILSAFGLDALLKNVSKKTIVFVCICVFAIMLSVNGYLFVSGGFPFLSKFHFLDAFKNTLSLFETLHLTTNDIQLQTVSRIVLIPDILVTLFTACFILFLFLKKQRFFFFSAVILTIVGQVYFANRYIPFSYPAFMYPNNPVFTYLQQVAHENRFISTQEGYISSNIPLFYNLYSPDGVGSMYIARYGELVKYMQTNGKSYSDIPRIETRIDPSQDEVFTQENLYLRRFMQIDGIKYVVTLRNNNVKSVRDFSLVWQNNTWQIYSFNAVSPRVFLTSDFTIAKNKGEILKSIFDSNRNPQSIVLEENPGITPQKNGEGFANFLSYTPNRVEIATSSQKDALLFLSDSYAQNFHAFVDKKPAKLVRADYAFRAVVVPSGKHTVTIMYEDAKEIVAFIVSAITGLGLLAGLFYLQKKKKSYTL